MKYVIERFYKEYHEAVLPNLWLGVTAENQEQAEKRIPILLDIPAAVRFVSVEPMLGPVSLAEYYKEEGNGCYSVWLDYIDWVIVGGETGSGARKMEPQWLCDLYIQIKIHETPFFFKNWGSVYEKYFIETSSPEYCDQPAIYKSIEKCKEFPEVGK